jgi:putative spermidine/putrescine transport system substrate-binding protein
MRPVLFSSRGLLFLAILVASTSANSLAAARTFAQPSSTDTAAQPTPLLGTPRLDGQTIRVYITGGGSYLDALESLVLEPFQNATGATVETDPTCCDKMQAAMQNGQFIGDMVIGNDRGGDLAYADQGWIVQEPRLLQLEQQRGMPESLQSDAVIPVDLYAWIMASRDKSLPQPQTWADFWDTQKFPGTRGLFKYPPGTLEAALLADGVPPDQLYPLDLDRAFAKLDQLRNSTKVLFWSGGAQQIQFLVSQETDYSLAFVNRIVQAQNDGTNLDFTFNQGLYAATTAGILKNARNPDGAVALLDFLLTPDVQARFAEATALAPPYPAATRLISPDKQPLMVTSPANFARVVPMSDDYWRVNIAAVIQRYTDWLGQS